MANYAPCVYLCFQVVKGDDVHFLEYRFAHLPFYTPDVIILSPEGIKPYLVTFLLDLSHLVIDPQHNVTVTAKGESLIFTVPPVFAVFDALLLKLSSLKSISGRW